MQRLLTILLTFIIAGAAFTYLWLTNPLYAFVGSIAFIVFMLVGLALLFNMPQDITPEDEQAIQPRRTGEFRRVRESDLPEASWEESESVPSRALEPPSQQQFSSATPPVAPAPSLQPTAPEADSDNKAARVREKVETESLNTSSEDMIDFADVDDNMPLLETDEEDDETVVPDIQMPSRPNAETTSESFDLMALVESLSPDQQQQFFALLGDIPIGEQSEIQLMALYQQIMHEDDSDTAPALDEVQFSAFYPRQAAAEIEYGLFVYAHLPDALISTDVEQFVADLGGYVPKATLSSDSAALEAHTALSVMITSDNLHFNQAGAIQYWHPPFVRFDFRFTAAAQFIDELAGGRIAIMLGLIEIASIDFKIMVSPIDEQARLDAIPQDPRYARHYAASDPINLYQKIFISYAREDTIIAEQYRKVQLMAGNTVFMDTHMIRSGEDWEGALQRAINEADVFQLFWSDHSAQSEHVRFEWQYALTQRCPQTRCVQFIRPAYWQKPLPPIPDDLKHLHFAFVDLDMA